MEAPRVPLNFDLKMTNATCCDNCDGEAFIEALMLRKVSALLSGTGKEGFVPIQVFACVKCGHVNSQFIPAEIRTTILPTKS